MCNVKYRLLRKVSSQSVSRLQKKPKWNSFRISRRIALTGLDLSRMWVFMEELKMLVDANLRSSDCIRGNCGYDHFRLINNEMTFNFWWRYLVKFNHIGKGRSAQFSAWRQRTTGCTRTGSMAWLAVCLKKRHFTSTLTISMLGNYFITPNVLVSDQSLHSNLVHSKFCDIRYDKALLMFTVHSGLATPSFGVAEENHFFNWNSVLIFKFSCDFHFRSYWAISLTCWGFFKPSLEVQPCLEWRQHNCCALLFHLTLH